MRGEDKDKFDELIKHAMQEDFSWTRSAKEYLSLYEKVLTE